MNESMKIDLGTLIISEGIIQQLAGIHEQRNKKRLESIFFWKFNIMNVEDNKQLTILKYF